jgi:ubiquinone/menaquinone biosynthesis C-methylase UbiE
MDAQFQRRIQRYGWDKAAGAYESGWRDSLALVQSKLIDIACPKPGERMLDTACGTGLVTFPLLEAAGRAGQVVATDISQAMIDTLTRDAECRGFNNIEAFRADAENLGRLEDNSFDLATCALGFMYFPDPDQAMREMFRVLRPGGRAVVAVWGARRNCGWAEVFPIVDARVHSSVCPMFFNLGLGRSLAMNMERAGFELVNDRRLTTDLPYESGDAAADAAFIGGPVALAYDRFTPQVRDEVRSEYLASIRAFQSGRGYNIPGEFVIASGRKPAA